MELFYSTSIHDNHFLLEGEEAHHLLKVLRHQEGDLVMITDGLGSIFTTRIVDANPKKCSLEIISRDKKDNDKNYSLHIAIAPTKNIDRFEWFLEKATEIGIDSITPFLCRHSERKVIKDERLRKVIVSAMKQSLKSFLPLLYPLTTFPELLKDCRAPQRYICTMSAEDLLIRRYDPHESTMILIGPEGDFSKEEVDLALKHGFVPVSLGNCRLRTETAALMACATIAIANMQQK
ncbi:MAG TPA: 16S rRNA (uracil(1498)-N(3))-methyltransferase [Bacteroidia bacterium]|nr:16S rRNA (uracil(1498)-N(3))-methyltransferase [Bacteroidia bacterium]HNS13224.1 16S rRNA (uracil(1498)-N(3))-methyltransferase [Bacteroidia bacterium]